MNPCQSSGSKNPINPLLVVLPGRCLWSDATAVFQAGDPTHPVGGGVIEDPMISAVSITGQQTDIRVVAHGVLRHMEHLRKFFDSVSHMHSP